MPLANFKYKFLINFGIFLFLCFLLPGRALAAKTLTITPSATEVEAGKVIEASIWVETDENISSLQLTLEIPTELIEVDRFTPNNTIFNGVNFQNGATGYVFGIRNTTFTGKGLVCNVSFRGKKAGEAAISFSLIKASVVINGTASWVSGFSSNSVTLNVYGQGQAPTTPTPPVTPGDTETITVDGKKEDLGPVPEASVQASPTNIQSTEAGTLSAPGDVTGSKTEVIGPTGAQDEQPLKTPGSVATTSQENPTVKGILSEGNGIYIGLFPTILLMMLVVYLGIKLFFTEKRRHLEVERIFDSELSALAALESKMDIFDQKGEGAKERFMAEFEDTKNKVMSEIGATIGQK